LNQIDDFFAHIFLIPIDNTMSKIEGITATWKHVKKCS